MTGHSRLVMRTSLLCGSLTAAGALVLTPTYGASGTAVMFTLGIVTQNMILLALTKRHVGIWTFVNVMPREYARLWKYP